MEKPPQVKDEKGTFYNRLLAEGLVDEVRPGLVVKAEDYRFVQGEEFAVKNLVTILTGYLTTPTLIDSFPSHEEDRVPAFNKAGVLDSDVNKKLYLSNRLRVNKISSVLRTLGVTVRVRELPQSFRDFIESEIKDFNIEHYSTLDSNQKVLLTERLATICINVINQAVAENIVNGPIM
jgi:hypothetical protein